MAQVNQVLIAEIHAAATDSHRWNSVVSLIHRQLPCCGVALAGYDKQANANLGVCLSGWPDETVSIYTSHFASVSPFVPAFQKSPVGKIQTDRQLVPWEQSSKSEFFNDFLAKLGFGGGTAIKLFHDEHRFFQLTLDFDYRQRAEVEERSIALLESIGSHMQQSFSRMRRLGSQRFSRATVNSILNLLPAIAFVLDRRNRIVAANIAGAAALQSATVVSVKQGRLSFCDQAAQRFMEHAIERLAISQFDGLDLSHIARGKTGRVLATVSPLPPDHEMADQPFHDNNEFTPFVLLTLTEFDPPPGDVSAIGRLFKLTSAEAKLAASLLTGQELREFAEQQGVSIHTVRNQLKSIFAKTDVTRQVELVALLHRLQTFRPKSREP